MQRGKIDCSLLVVTTPVGCFLDPGSMFDLKSVKNNFVHETH